MHVLYGLWMKYGAGWHETGMAKIVMREDSAWLIF